MYVRLNRKCPEMLASPWTIYWPIIELNYMLRNALPCNCIWRIVDWRLKSALNWPDCGGQRGIAIHCTVSQDQIPPLGGVHQVNSHVWVSIKQISLEKQVFGRTLLICKFPKLLQMAWWDPTNANFQWITLFSFICIFPWRKTSLNNKESRLGNPQTPGTRGT